MDLLENKLADLIKEDEKAKWRPVNNHNTTQFTQDDIKRITKNYATPIGKGAFGQVYLGHLDSGSLAAVKKYIQKNSNEGFAKELIVHSQINHKSVVRLLGYCTEENDLMIVTEFISNGNLSELLHISHDRIPLDTRLSIAVECAEALNYMHSMYQPIIHGDIKPENILLDDKLGAKLSDFGISRLLSMDTQYTINVIGSIGYADPEFILKGRINPKNDVYSFGVVLLELITRKKICVNGMCTDLTENFIKAIEKGKNIREMLDTEILDDHWKILKKVGKLVADCLKKNLNERPDMKDVVQRLHMLTKSYYDYGINSNSTLLHKVGNLDFFNRTALSKVVRNQLSKLTTVTLFTMKELVPILKSGNIIGRDNYFETYMGYLGDGKWPVTVMKSTIKDSVGQNTDFVNELATLSEISHKNILTLFGCCIENDIIVLVFGFASKVSLDGILHGVNMMPLSLDVRLQIAAQTASGLAYLHSKIPVEVLHGDVKPNNILLNDNFEAKIPGFDLSRLISQGTEILVFGLYMDPVYLQTGLLTSKSDVYSFGIVLLELFTRKKHSFSDNKLLLRDFLDAYSNKYVIKLVDQEIAIEENMELLYSITEIIAQCLNLDIDQRPDMTYVAKYLEDIEETSGRTNTERLHMLTKSYYDYGQGKEKTTQWSLWGEQKVDRDNMNRTNSNSTLLNKVGSLDIFNRTARSRVIRNVSPTITLLSKIQTLKLFTMNELSPIIKSSNFIARDNYFDTYKGYLGGATWPVAVKRSIKYSVGQSTDFVNELVILSGVRHKNILKLIGCCLENDVLVLVFEFASKGSLDDLLHHSRMPVSLDVRLYIATQTARGLAYMHSENSVPVLHGDVKPDNILLDHKMEPKISGFGLPRLISQDTDFQPKILGFGLYMDLTYLQTGLLTSKSDVYSFGIVLLELLTRRKLSLDNNLFLRNFLDDYRNKKLIQLVDPDIARAENMELLHSITEIIAQCLNPDIDQRPEMIYVDRELNTLKRRHGNLIHC